jgi:hypothetical protein
MGGRRTQRSPRGIEDCPLNLTRYRISYFIILEEVPGRSACAFPILRVPLGGTLDDPRCFTHLKHLLA